MVASAALPASYFPPVARAGSAPRNRAGACENRFGSIGGMRRIASRDLRVFREELRSPGHVVPHLLPREQRRLKLAGREIFPIPRSLPARRRTDAMLVKVNGGDLIRRLKT
jgi:hypothetical protein